MTLRVGRSSESGTSTRIARLSPCLCAITGVISRFHSGSPIRPLHYNLGGRNIVPNKRIAAAGNTVVPALLVLENLGFDVAVRSSSLGQTVVAVRGEEQYQGDDPVAVLGLIKLIEVRSWEWLPADSEIDNTTRKYRLDHASKP
jgi:hypothetical protein